MSFNYEGFFSKEVEGLSEDIYDSNRKLFVILKEYNKLGHKLKFDLKIHNNNAQEVTVSGLFILILNNLYSIYELTLRGLTKDAKIILRTMVEKLIILKYCSLEYKNSVQYLQQDELNRLKWMNTISENKIKGFSGGVLQSVTKEEIIELKAKIEESNIKKLPKLEDLSQIVGLEEMYSYVYRLCSSEIHANPSTIESLFLIGSNNEINTIKWYPDIEEVKNDSNLILVPCIDIVDKVISVLIKLYEVDNLENYEKEFSLLNNKFNDSLNPI
ncbi:DUF5677 domain-containing protein [Ornithinibacillus xuwenensis]|uniref:DUF5677 domain-containing protein n=1 Tax=Ornithinibacillus xuwenensis TaxID=3144668 RepID=A0ABU9XC72_9BACI